MKTFHAALGLAASTALTVGGTFVLPAAPVAAAGMPVFDVTNYAQNLLQAARALDQINNQVKSLQNEASMLEGMPKNLKTIPFPQLQRLTSAMQQIDQLMGQAQGIQFKVAGLDQQVKSLFPGPSRNRRVAARPSSVACPRRARSSAASRYSDAIRFWSCNCCLTLSARS